MADPAVLFEPRAPALAQRLAARRQIAFDRLQHRYAAERARAAWLAFHTEPPPARWLTGSAEPRPSSRLSVCIPYYNHPRELRRLLEALSEQTVGDFELVAVNDGSAPAAREVFDACAAQYAARGYRFLTTENRGPGAARNAAAAAARGDHLLFFDADNVPHRDMVERFPPRRDPLGGRLRDGGLRGLRRGRRRARGRRHRLSLPSRPAATSRRPP